MNRRWGVFGIALAVRCAAAFVFFGSVDLTNSMLNAQRMLDGMRASELPVPYLPGVQSVIWAAGVIGFHTALPVAFPYKVVACLFDSAIAAMIGDARGTRAGLLYAAAPVPVIIAAIHGQWDAISLAFFLAAMLLLRRDGWLAAAGAGACAVLSVVAKPIAVPLLLFLVERKRVLPLTAGAAAAGAAYLVVLAATGDPLTFETLSYVLDYARGGVTYLGLPHGLGIAQNRLLLLVPIVVLVPLYAIGRVAREHAVLLAYAWLLGTCGLSAQYLMWLVPFLLLLGRNRFAGIYSALAGVYLTIFYVSLGVAGRNHENLGALAPLRELAWLTPALTHVDAKATLLVVVGDFLLPIACLVWLATRGWRAPRAAAVRAAGVQPLLAASAVTLAFIGVALSLPRPGADALAARTAAKAAAYDLVLLPWAPGVPTGEPTWVIPTAAGAAARSNPLDATFLLIAWIGAWTAAAFILAMRDAAEARDAGVADRPSRG